MSNVFGNIMQATEAGRKSRQDRLDREQLAQQRSTFADLLKSGDTQGAQSYALQMGNGALATQVGQVETDRLKAASDRLNLFSQTAFSLRQAPEAKRPALARAMLVKAGMSDEEVQQTLGQIPSYDDQTLAAIGMQVMSVKDQLDTRQMGTYQVNDDVMGWQTNQVTGEQSSSVLGTANPAYSDVTTRTDAEAMRAEQERSNRVREGTDRRRLDLEEKRLEQGGRQPSRSGMRLVDGTNPNGQAVPMTFDPNTGSMQPVNMPDGYTYVPDRGQDSYQSSLGLTLGGNTPPPSAPAASASAPPPMPEPVGNGQIPQVTTKEQHAALPSGAQYIGPDGVVRIKS